MRCFNCGFDNEPGRQTCIKCGNSLHSDDDYAPKQPIHALNDYDSTKPTIVFDGRNADPSMNQLKETVIQQADDSINGGTAYGLKPTIVQGNPKSCPRCHYPLNGSFCANCGYEVSNSSVTPEESQQEKIDNDIIEKIKNRQTKCPNCNADVPAKFLYCPYCGTSIPQTTIDIYSLKNEDKNPKEKPSVHHRFSLTPIVGNNEAPSDKHILELDDNKIVLNRENTDPGNRTITSKEQAEVRFEEGKWMLENLSEYNSTFIAATHPLELHPGDIILMGDQRFSFDIMEDGEE